MPESPAAVVVNPLRGIALKIGSVAIFVLMSGLLKLSGDVPAGQIVFFRSFFAIPPVLAILWWQGQLLRSFHTKRPIDHFWRGLVGTASMTLTFFALTRLTLPDAITLGYAQPLLVVVFSAIFMGETIRVYRWAAVAVGLVGVVIVSWPKLTLFSSNSVQDTAQAVGVVAAVTATALSATAALLIRRLVHTERTATVVIWFSISSSIFALFTLPFGWDYLTMEQTIYLICGGMCGGVAQMMMTEAYRYAEASVVAPFEYTSLILAIAFGFLIFGDLPTAHTIIGGLIVVGAGLYIVWRERQLGIERAKARKVTPPQ